MLTIEQIKNITFRKANLGGYRPDDVEAFIDEVQVTFDEMVKEKQELIRKLEILAKKVEEYREEEESIRHTLLSAQKLADASVREAKHKAEVIMKDATMSAEQIVSDAENQIAEQKSTIESLQKEVVSFRSRLLAIYKEHLTLIDALPAEDSFKKDEEPEASLEETAAKAEQMEEISSGREEENTPDFEKIVRQVEEESKSQPAPEEAKPETTEDNGESGGFQINLSAVDEIEERTPPKLQSRFDSIKFGDDYDIEKDTETPDSPLGMFKRRK